MVNDQRHNVELRVVDEFLAHQRQRTEQEPGQAHAAVLVAAGRQLHKLILVADRDIRVAGIHVGDGQRAGQAVGDGRYLTRGDGLGESVALDMRLLAGILGAACFTFAWRAVEGG